MLASASTVNHSIERLEMADRCENCKRKTPGRWMCDECMMVFDGDRFHNELLPDGYLESAEDDEEDD